MTYATKRSSILALLILASAFVIGGCAQESQTPSIENQSVSLLNSASDQTSQVYAENGPGNGRYGRAVVYAENGPGNGRTGRAVVYAENGPGNGRAGRAVISELASDVGSISVSGDTLNADAVLVNVNSQEFSITVDADGHFEASIPVSAVPQNVILTAMAGEIAGQAVTAEISQ